MRVWITRTEPGAGRVAARLGQAGVQCVVAPVLAIEPVEQQFLESEFVEIQDAVFLSEHAAALAGGALRSFGEHVRTFAIGQQTAARLAEFGVDARVPATATSEGLLAMDGLKRVTGRKVLILAGEGGREVLHQGLTERGAQVRRLALYRRSRVPLERVRAAVDPQQIQAIAISSGDGFHGAAQVWFAADGSPEVAVLTPSPRVTQMGGKLGFSRVITCRGADADALIAGLAKFEG